MTVRTHDVVILVPGIMGSELLDADSGATLWGLRDLRWYVRAWSTGAGLAALSLTDDERQGRYGRVVPGRMLRFPAFARVFAGFEPYQRLIDAAREAVYFPDAQIVEFGYDWRLPVAHNGGRLAEEASKALTAWRADPRHDRTRRGHPSGRAAQLVVVAHSMGGLLARWLARDEGLAAEVRATVTLGTPFYGSVKAAVLLNSGRGTPLPARRPLTRTWRSDADEGVRHLASTLPGLHDLLPTYRSVDQGTSGRRLTEADAVALGADAELTRAAFAMHHDMRDVPLPGHRNVVGAFQPTRQSIRLDDGEITAHEGLWIDQADGVRWVDEGGDGTVYRRAASLDASGPAHTYLPQQHGALARTDEACTLVRGVISEQDLDRLGPPLAGGALGLELPDIVFPGELVAARVTGIDGPRDAVCRVLEAATGRMIGMAPIESRNGRWHAILALAGPGLYRVELAGGGYGSVTQLLLVADPS
ncbi:esterase/lipase family protein [Micromonospora sp. DT227]|uniref:esterase/lipase family protein n=1 Tax=Micromonospora sp. DT227 TaxID=3393433 RepID=UPI003CE75D98